MKIVYNYIKDFLKNEFELIPNISIILFVGICIFINYTINLDNGIIGSYHFKSIRILLYFSLYSFMYFGTLFTIRIIKNDWRILKNRQFWIISIFAVTFFAIHAGFPFSRIIVSKIMPHNLFYYGLKCFYNAYSIFTIIIPTILLFIFLKRWNDFKHWITPSWANTKPYFILILLMVPLVMIASFQSDFMNTYPTYRNYNEELILHVPKLVTIFIYELFYGMDFFSVELMFRGVLVAGLVSILGKDAILPMAAMYVSIHFGKPLGETISSFFGGYFLGIITINSHNIIGGTIVHMGIAWLMELTSFMQLWWKDSSS